MKKPPNYLTNMILKSRQSLRTRTNRIPTLYCRTSCFKKNFFPSALSDWFQLDVTIRNSELIAIFKSRLLSFIRPIQSDIYNIFHPIGLEFLTCFHLDFSHLNEHRFRHIFKTSQILYVLIVWKPKMQNITFSIAIISPNTVLILSLVWNIFLKVLILCLTMPKKICFYMETHVLI